MLHLPSRRRLLTGLGAAAALALSGTGAYAFGVEPYWRLAVRRYAPALPGWPEGLRLRIAVITDLHIGEPTMPLARAEEIVAATNALKPDLVAVLGDFLSGRSSLRRRIALADVAALTARLSAPLGVHTVLGNHDWWGDARAQSTRRGPTEIARALEAAGLSVLENDAVRLVHDGQPFWVAGLADQIPFEVQGVSRGLDDLPGTLARIGDDAPVILLAHEPDVFPRVPARVALTLSGHTHGGQVRLLGYSPVTSSRYGNRYAYGHMVENGRHLVVSGGLGTSRLPVRLGVPPEIVLVEPQPGGPAHPVA